MENFLNFIRNKKELQELRNLMNEAFKSSDWTNAMSKITDILKKKIDHLCYCGCFEIEQDGKHYMSFQYIVAPSTKERMMFTLNAKMGSSADIYSIDMYKNMDLYIKNKAKTAVTIFTMGESVAKFLPLIIEICNTRNFALAQKQGGKDNEVREHRNFYIGHLKWVILENISDLVIDDTFKIMCESAELDAKKQERDEAYKDYRKNGGNDKRSRYQELDKEYQQLLKAEQGGDTKVGDIKFTTKSNLSTLVVPSREVAEGDKKLQANSNKTPKQAVNDMRRYIGLVLHGLSNCFILTGQAGFGKTYNIEHILESEGFTSVFKTKQYDNRSYADGKKYYLTIGGKITTPMLYVSLYLMRNKGDMIVIDDADTILDKNDLAAISILKNALNSSGKREVSYLTKSPIKDSRLPDFEIPKTFEYEGCMTIISNKEVADLDSAIRSRSIILTVSFSSELMLLYIHDEIMDKMLVGVVSPKAKTRAYDYLLKLAKGGSSMSISCRTFENCAKIYSIMDWDNTFTDEMAQSMIAEQMAALAA